MSVVVAFDNEVRVRTHKCACHRWNTSYKPYNTATWKQEEPKASNI